MRKVTPESWEQFQQTNKNMIHFLTLIRSDESACEFLMGLDHEDWYRLPFTLGVTVLGLLTCIASAEGHTLTEQIQILALDIQSMTPEEAETRLNNPGGNLWQ